MYRVLAMYSDDFNGFDAFLLGEMIRANALMAFY